VVFNGHFGTHRVFGHTLLLAVVLLSAAVTFTSRRSGRRKALIGLVIGMLLHLVLDGVWSDPATFLWPAFGWTFPAMQPAELGPLVGQMVRDPLVWAGEAAGVSYLVFLERRRLRDAAARRAFLRHGVIPLRA
jgi:hypothetical protein